MNRFSRFVSLAVVPSLLGVSVGCQSTGEAPSAPEKRLFMSADAQIKHGGAVYGNNCATCHGNSGQGTGRAPALVGEGALSGFASAMDVAVFATQNMPPKRSHREAIPEHDYWAVLAFALSANGVQLSEPVGPDNAGEILLGS